MIRRIVTRNSALSLSALLLALSAINCATSASPSSNSRAGETSLDSPPPAPPAPRVSVRVRVGGNFNVQAGGCEDRAQTFSVEAPGGGVISKRSFLQSKVPDGS